VPDSRITVIPNGVPVGHFAPALSEQRLTAKELFGIDGDSFVLLSISALVPEKGVDVAIRAASAIEDCHLLVVGDGPERASLEQLAAEVAPGGATFTGALTEPIAAYRAADVVLLPSLGGDTMPATLIEAGLCGLPSVATPIGAIEEIVLHDRSGFIVPPGDVEALVTSVETLRGDPDRAAAMGLVARRHCLDTFAIDRVGAQWADILSVVIADEAS
jgi:glycosyltransferase involved in cell wall biosynthesis